MIRLATHTEQAQRLISRALPYCVGTKTANMDDMTAGCDLFEVLENGEIIGAFAAEILTGQGIKTISVTAAGGMPGHDIAGQIADWADKKGAALGATQLTCTTQRRGLVKRLQKAGYTVAGYIMTKEV